MAVIGAGGLAHACFAALARTQVQAELVVFDDDIVEESNLHRQIFFADTDIGKKKAPTLLKAVAELSKRRLQGTSQELRIRPETLSHLHGFDVVLDGSDNFATKFLVSDFCRDQRIDCVQGGVLGWRGWAMARSGTSDVCLRCVFEETRGHAGACDELGVVGPVVGVIGSLQAQFTHELLTTSDQGDWCSLNDEWIAEREERVHKASDRGILEVFRSGAQRGGTFLSPVSHHWTKNTSDLEDWRLMKSRGELGRPRHFSVITTSAHWGETERACSRSEGAGGSPLSNRPARLAHYEVGRKLRHLQPTRASDCKHD